MAILLVDGARPELVAVYGRNAVDEIESELEVINGPDAEEERVALVRAVKDESAITILGYRLEPDDVDLEVQGTLAEAVREYGNTRGPFPFISVTLIAIAGSIIFSAYSRALNHIWKVRTLRPMIQQKVIDFAALLIVGLLLLASIIASGIVGASRSSVAGTMPDWFVVSDLAWLASLLAVPLLVSFTFCASAYMFLPRRRNPFRDIWLGALVGAVGFEGLKFGYSLYIAYFSSYDESYGAFGAVLCFLFFVYMSSYLLLLGAEVAYTYPVVRDASPEPSPSSGATAPARRGALRMLWAAIAGLFISRDRE